MKLVGIGIILCFATTIYGQSNDAFSMNSCHEDYFKDLENRMPNSIDNFIALIEKYEMAHQSTSIQDMAEGFVHRYKKDGVIYAYNAKYDKWARLENEELTKQKILDKILAPDFEIQHQTYDLREECSLHFMLSHSSNIYRHGEISNIWEESTRRRRRSSGMARSIQLPDGMEPSDHPLENGVIHTYWGPIAGGTLMDGLSAHGQSSSSTIERILQGDDLEYMPSEMKSTTFSPVIYAATLSGDIAQAARPLLNILGEKNVQISPKGKFYPHSACPRLYSQENKEISYITRAEILAGIDALLISKALESSNSRDLKLSELLRMYYSETGLPGKQEYRACNRVNLFQELDKEKIKQQARNFMYALSNEYTDLIDLIEREKKDFDEIERTYTAAVETIWSAVESFVRGEAREYSECPTYTNKDIKGENRADLFVVLGGGSSDGDIQRELLAHVAQKIGVSYHGSRIALLNGKSTEYDDTMNGMTNHSNIADWSCNYTTNNQGGSSSTDMAKQLIAIEEYYKELQTNLEEDMSSYGANAQVLLWMSPKMSGDRQQFVYQFGNFSMNYPEVTVIITGRSRNDFDFMMNTPEEDFFTLPSSHESEEIEEEAEKIARRIKKAPAMFVYPACNTTLPQYENYAEAQHSYTGYVSPNHTTFLKIGARTIQYSEYVELKFDGNDMEFCASRTDVFPKEGNVNVTCKASGEPIRFMYPCNRHLEDCDDIYVAIRVKEENSVGSLSCTDKECLYPNQLKYEMHHEGIVCGAEGLLPVPILLLVAIFLYRFV